MAVSLSSQFLVAELQWPRCSRDNCWPDPFTLFRQGCWLPVYSLDSHGNFGAPIDFGRCRPHSCSTEKSKTQFFLERAFAIIWMQTHTRWPTVTKAGCDYKQESVSFLKARTWTVMQWGWCLPISDSSPLWTVTESLQFREYLWQEKKSWEFTFPQPKTCDDIHNHCHMEQPFIYIWCASVLLEIIPLRFICVILPYTFLGRSFTWKLKTATAVMVLCLKSQHCSRCNAIILLLLGINRYKTVYSLPSLL